MRLDKKIVGKYINLRTAEPEDAAFTLSLRNNPDLNQYLKPVDPDIQKQVKWILQKQKEEGDYHMIIEDKENNPLGLVAIYDVDLQKKSFDWGRWIISPESPLYTGIESMALVYRLAFHILKLNLTRFEVRLGNVSVIKLHEMYATKLETDGVFQYFEFTAEGFENSSLFKRFLN